MKSDGIWLNLVVGVTGKYSSQLCPDLKLLHRLLMICRILR